MEAYAQHVGHPEAPPLLALPPMLKSPLPRPKKGSRADGTGSKGGSGRPEGYSRKAKSLSLLCENFITRFGIPESVISLDGSAKALGVERRRIYDIVNVLESVKVVTKVQKNQYTWHGMDRLGPALEELRAEAEAELAEVGASGAEGLLTLDERKEKSMTRLSQRFVQMFMLSKSKALGLDEAARALLGGTEDAGLFKTKVRRLYDIANILSALHLIEKAHVGEKGKPGFRWLGPEAVMAAAQRSSEEAAAAAAAAAAAHTLESAGDDAAAVAALHAHFQRTQQPMLPQHASAAAAAAAAAAALWNGAAAGAGADPLALAQLQQLQQSLPMVGDPSRPLGILSGQGAPGGATQLAGAPAPPGGAPDGAERDAARGAEDAQLAKRARLGEGHAGAAAAGAPGGEADPRAALAAADLAAANLVGVLADPSSSLLGADASTLAAVMNGSLGPKLSSAVLSMAGPGLGGAHAPELLPGQHEAGAQAGAGAAALQRGKVHPLARFMELESSTGAGAAQQAHEHAQQEGAAAAYAAYGAAPGAAPGPGADPLAAAAAAAGVWGWDALGINGWMGPQLNSVYWQLAQQQAAAGAASLHDQLQALQQAPAHAVPAPGRDGTDQAGAQAGTPAEGGAHADQAPGQSADALAHAARRGEFGAPGAPPDAGGGYALPTPEQTLALAGQGPSPGDYAANPSREELLGVPGNPALEPLAVALQLGLPLPGSGGVQGPGPAADQSDEAAVLAAAAAAAAAEGGTGDPAANGGVPIQYLHAWSYYNMYNPWMRQAGASGDLVPHGAGGMEQAGQPPQAAHHAASPHGTPHDSLHV